MAKNEKNQAIPLCLGCLIKEIKEKEEKNEFWTKEITS